MCPHVSNYRLLALLLSALFSAPALSADDARAEGGIGDGSNDVIEEFGGYRNGFER